MLVVTQVNSTTVNVSWSEIQCLNGSEAVTHYLVQYQSLHGVVQNVTTNDTDQVVSGLIPNYVYTFQVAAVGAGQKIGPFSSPVNVSLPGECRRSPKCSNECFDYNTDEKFGRLHLNNLFRLCTTLYR